MSIGLATVLTVLGLGLFLYKALALGFPVFPGEKSDLWDVEARVKFSARGSSVKVSLFIPCSTRWLASAARGGSKTLLSLLRGF